ncbi:hypothetical protein SAMN05660649_00404 [Desulfotomaculum arcticum]|uniref:Uncharacterized protein n=1 Tax=Desulfotruncus arcticus DSM 17038 TaxID=1121424 RepID=A0A1I2NED2_9FIRM|nr:hypothetical protein [Desulfotruncus arcticus]SFF99721.1 hypothetical protein SAMN05660649_00404 [Desulfotomaculum arcticum] [Desulfotruncus arcticus DSM 17038]
MISEKGKTFSNSYDTNIAVGNPVIFPGGSLIPIVNVTSIYSGTTKHFCTGGGCIILDPLAIFVIQESNLEICLIKQTNLTDNLSNLISLATELFN